MTMDRPKSLKWLTKSLKGATLRPRIGGRHPGRVCLTSGSRMSDAGPVPDLRRAESSDHAGARAFLMPCFLGAGPSSALDDGGPRGALGAVYAGGPRGTRHE